MEIAVRLQHFDQLLERYVLVGERPQRNLPHPLQDLWEGGAPREIGAQHEGVHEEADETLQAGPGACRHGRADDDVGEPGLALEDQFEGGQQGHEEGGPFAPAQALDLAGEHGRDAARATPRSPPTRGPGRTRAGERDLGRGPSSCFVQ